MQKPRYVQATVVLPNVTRADAAAEQAQALAQQATREELSEAHGAYAAGSTAPAPAQASTAAPAAASGIRRTSGPRCGVCKLRRLP